MLIVEFGSKHNGRRDLYSDRDLLIVGNDWEKISSLERHYKSYGYSISCFKKDKAEYLSGKGSLFFKHIIDEGVVVSDENNFKTETFNSWVPRDHYNDEIESNLALLEVFKSIPNNKYAQNFINDILIISIRNILIRRIAEYGEYVFGWENIFEKSKEYCLLPSDAIPVLMASRKLKNSYRANVIKSIEHNFISNILEISSKLFGLNIKLGKENKKEILNLPGNYQDGSYIQLRAVELLCSYYSFDSSLSNYIEMVRKPNYSCATKAITIVSSRP